MGSSTAVEQAPFHRLPAELHDEGIFGADELEGLRSLLATLDDPGELQSALWTQPKLEEVAGYLHEKMRTFCQRAEDDLNDLWNQFYRYYRNLKGDKEALRQLDIGSSLTENLIKGLIEDSDEYVEARSRLRKMEYFTGQLKVLYKTYRSRARMLESYSHNARQEARIVES